MWPCRRELVVLIPTVVPTAGCFCHARALDVVEPDRRPRAGGEYAMTPATALVLVAHD
jgi:hypothetical protein